jgi:quercetin dioxygenase-like cupin family protein
MPLDPLGQEISKGVFYHRIYDAAGVRVDRFVVRPGATVPFHTNAEGQGYKLVACSNLKFLSLTEDGRVNEYRQMAPGEVLVRPQGFGHTLVNVSDEDFVILKMWPPD